MEQEKEFKVMFPGDICAAIEAGGREKGVTRAKESGTGRAGERQVPKELAS